jgi:hypothetical protein
LPQPAELALSSVPRHCLYTGALAEGGEELLRPAGWSHGDDTPSTLAEGTDNGRAQLAWGDSKTLCSGLGMTLVLGRGTGDPGHDAEIEPFDHEDPVGPR